MKNNTSYIVLFLPAAVTLLALSACQKVQTAPEAMPKEEIVLDVTSAAEASNATKATLVTDNTDLQGREMHIDAYYNGTTVKYLNGVKLRYAASSWGFVNGSGEAIHCYWPIPNSQDVTNSVTVDANSTLDFVGYSPYTLPGYISNFGYTAADGNPSFDCDMSSFMSSATQNGDASKGEFILAKTADRTIAGGTVPMNFIHPFAAVYLQMTSAAPGLTNVSVTFKSIRTQRSYTFGTGWGEWAETPATANFVVSESVNFDDHDFTEPAPIGGPYLFIPQEFTGSPKRIVMDITFTIANSTNRTYENVYVEMDEWLPGYIYTYSLQFEDDTILINTSVTTTWTDRGSTGTTVTPTA